MLSTIYSVMHSYVLVFASSFISYFIFKQFEPPTHAYTTLTLLLGAVPMALGYATDLATSEVFISYYGLIITFIAIYRLSPFHPLAAYPGPWQGHLSQFWLAYVNWTGKIHIYYRSLHERYGDVVRVGPNELSFRNTDAIQSILGVNGLNKGPFWDHRHPPGATGHLPSLRDLVEHKRRRHPWNLAFGQEAMNGYQQLVVNSTKTLLEAFSIREDETIDIAQWMIFFAFDFMGSMAFGRDFGLVKNGKDPEGLWEILENSITFNSTLGCIPWAGRTLRSLPIINKKAMELRNVSLEWAKHRISEGTVKRDLFYYLNDEDGKLPQKPLRSEVTSDGLAAVIAGSDTTALTLSGLFYFLITNESVYKRLQEDIDSAFPRDIEPADTVKMATMPYLNACINETLRLLPAVPSGGQRSIPPGTGGRVINGSFVPEKTQVFVHIYSLQRDPRYFSPRPDSFWPERWLSTDQRQSTEKIVHDLSAFIPFSFGPANCVGKPLALMELRSVVCFILQKYHVKVAPGGRAKDLVGRWEETWKDHYTTQWGKLPVILTPRN